MPRRRMRLRRSRGKTLPAPPPLPASPPPPALPSSSIPTPARRLARPQPPTKRSCGEITGIATAECTAVMCCCPCCALNFLYLATVRLPAGLCRKAVREGRRRGRVAAVVPDKQAAAGRDEASLGDWGSTATPNSTNDVKDGDGGGMAAILKLLGEASDEDEVEGDAEMRQLEEDMWDWFDATGFWRSPTKMDWKF